ncbi:MAG: aminopeptidase P family N-terminal domain-containing protein, partial [Clostridia bacterium]|nr:aminopeptidase P family N-terminal domain-containing protein [Clostridia bacterium]
MKINNAEKIYNMVGAEAVLTEAGDLRKYLTGLSTSFGYVLTDIDGTTFYTDSRYFEGAANALKDADISV